MDSTLGVQSVWPYDRSLSSPRDTRVPKRFNAITAYNHTRIVICLVVAEPPESRGRARIFVGISRVDFEFIGNERWVLGDAFEALIHRPASPREVHECFTEDINHCYRNQFRPRRFR